MRAATEVKVIREQRRAAADARMWEREKMMWEKLLTPATVRILMILGIIAYSTYCTRSKENVGPVQSALAFAGPGIAIPIIAADAGITDWRALAGISAAGLGYTGLSMVKGWDSKTTLEVIMGALPGIGPYLANLVLDLKD